MLGRLYVKPKDPDIEEAPVFLSEQIIRAELVVVGADEQEWKVIVLDAEDTFDVVLHFPNDRRDLLFTVSK